MSVRMTIVAEYVGITSAMLAKYRLKDIIKQDREAVPVYRWVERWTPSDGRAMQFREAWRFAPGEMRKLSKYIVSWTRRR